MELEIDAEEGTLCDAKNSGPGLFLDIDFGPISQRNLDEDYMKKNDVAYVFQSVIGGLMMERPADHVGYIESRLKELKVQRERAKNRLTLIALNVDVSKSECGAPRKAPEPVLPDLEVEKSWRQFVDPLHPDRSAVKQKFYLDCREEPEREEHVEDEDDSLRQPMSLFNLAMRIAVRRETNFFDVPVLKEPIVLDIGKIAEKPLFNFQDGL